MSPVIERVPYPMISNGAGTLRIDVCSSAVGPASRFALQLFYQISKVAKTLRTLGFCEANKDWGFVYFFHLGTTFSARQL